MTTQSAPGVHEAVLDLLAGCPDRGHLLDLGCGRGELTRRIAALGRFEITAVDRCADPGIEGVRFLCVDLEHPDRLSGEYDVVVCTEVLEHLRDPWTLVAAIGALLRTQGTLLLSTPNIESAVSRLWFLLHGRLHNFTDHDVAESGHIHPLAAWQLQLMLDSAGLDIREVKTTQYSPVVRTMKDRLFVGLVRVLQSVVRPQHPGNILVLRAAKRSVRS